MSAPAIDRDPARVWNPCLGLRLAGGVIEYLDLAEPADDDLVMLTLVFEPGRLARRLAVTQTQTDWALASLSGGARGSLALPRQDAADHPLLAPALGRRHDRALWYAGNGHIKAVRLDFGGAAFALGLGHHAWDGETGTARFDGFWGDDLVLWSAAEFDALLCSHPLIVAADQSKAL